MFRIKSLKVFPKKHNNKIIEIGNLIREEIINTKIFDDENKFDFIKILVLGGSQAAKIFAEELPFVFEKLKRSEIRIKIYQQCLKDQTLQLSQFYEKAKINNEIFNFSDNILNYYSKVNLVITRAGASVLGELVNLKTPFIAIPLPTSADNHQLKNAEFYEKKGYGYLLQEKEIKTKLFELIDTIIKNRILKKGFIYPISIF